MITFKHTISLAALLISLPLGAMEREHLESGSPEKKLRVALKRYIKEANPKKFRELLYGAFGIIALEGFGPSPFVKVSLDERAVALIKEYEEEIQIELGIRKDLAESESLKKEAVPNWIFSSLGLILSAVGISKSRGECRCMHVSDIKPFLGLVSVFAGAISCKNIYDRYGKITNAEETQNIEYLMEMKEDLDKILKIADITVPMTKHITSESKRLYPELHP